MRPFPAPPALIEGDVVTIPPPAVAAVPVTWLNGLPGERLVTLHVWVWPSLPEVNAISVCASGCTMTHWWVHGWPKVVAMPTDFAIHADGYSRLLVFADDLAPRAGAPDSAPARD